VDAQQRDVATEFGKKWEGHELQGWEDSSQSKSQANGGEDAGIWCSACEDSRLTPNFSISDVQIGQKHYSKQTVYDAHLTSKKHIKATAKQASSGETSANPNGTMHSEKPHHAGQSSAKLRIRNSAYYTCLATDLLVALIPTLNETKSNVERRFSLTAREREQEILERDKPAPPPPTSAVDGAGDEDEEEKIYNPLKLPLGWDGKPIPYWLYKLHGLGVEYRCEICSDHVYMGRFVTALFLMQEFLSDLRHPRKNFDRHFQVSGSRFLYFFSKNYITTGIKACFWNACSRSAKYQTFPRNNSHRRCFGL